MAFSKQGLAVIVLLCCYTSSLAGDEGNEIVKVSLGPDSGKKEFVQGTLFQTDHTSYSYATCEWTKPEIEKTCEITWTDRPFEKRACSGIRVFTDPDRVLFLNGYFQTIPFSQDHVVLAWWDQPKDNSTQKGQKKNFKVAIVDMVNCKQANLNYPIDEVAYGRLPSLLFFPDRLDVIVNSKPSCDNAAQCRLSYDLAGRQIGGAMPYKPELLGYANPVSQSSPDKGFFVNVQDLTSLRVLLVKMNGEGELLSTDTFEPNAVKQRFAFNSAHEKFTICRMPDKNLQRPTDIHCNQYDSKGKITIKKSISFPEIAKWISVRSLAGGGFLVASADCDASRPAANCPNFRVWKVQADGKIDEARKFGLAKVSCNDMSSDLQARITEDQVGRFCFDFSCLANETLTYARSWSYLREDLDL